MTRLIAGITRTRTKISQTYYDEQEYSAITMNLNGAYNMMIHKFSNR